jgi:HSP20 family molecular chaperone IbpA
VTLAKIMDEGLLSTSAAPEEYAAMTTHETNGTLPAEATRTEPVYTPPTDIIETASGVQMVLDMPGADPDSLW